MSSDDVVSVDFVVFLADYFSFSLNSASTQRKNIPIEYNISNQFDNQTIQ